MRTFSALLESFVRVPGCICVLVCGARGAHGVSVRSVVQSHGTTGRFHGIVSLDPSAVRASRHSVLRAFAELQSWVMVFSGSFFEHD